MSLPYRLGSRSLFVRTHEDSIEPKRVVFSLQREQRQKCTILILLKNTGCSWGLTQ